VGDIVVYAGPQVMLVTAGSWGQQLCPTVASAVAAAAVTTAAADSAGSSYDDGGYERAP
jgi:hypothetical protein